MSTTMPYSNPTTSRAAALTASKEKAKADRKALRSFIANMGEQGATDEEIARAVPSINANAVRIRRGECSDAWVITVAGGLRRLTTSGNPAQVWRITAKGLRLLKRPPTDWHEEAAKC